jgi:hypothetical protein
MFGFGFRNLKKVEKQWAKQMFTVYLIIKNKTKIKNSKFFLFFIFCFFNKLKNVWFWFPSRLIILVNKMQLLKSCLY